VAVATFVRDDMFLADTRPGGRTLVVIPAYNEDRYIGSLVLKLRSDGYSVVVVDDGSADRTAELSEAAGAEVVRHGANQGKAAAIRSAFTLARERDVEALVLIDADSQHEAEEVGQVAAPILAGQADMVVGSRYVGAQSQIPGWRQAGQHALTAATNIGSGVHLTDSQSGFRAFSRKAIEVMNLRTRGFSVESEMQFEARDAGLTVVEVPIHVHYDIPLKRNPVLQGMHIVEALLRLIGQHRPLLFFSGSGSIVLLAGLALGLHVVRVYEATLTLAVGFAMLTVLLCLSGMLAIFVGIMLHTLRTLFIEFRQ
jgi:glycosyltransferase involved in cell wall biosynthesis